MESILNLKNRLALELSISLNEASNTKLYDAIEFINSETLRNKYKAAENRDKINLAIANNINNVTKGINELIKGSNR